MKMDFEWAESPYQMAKTKAGGRNGMLFLATEAARFMDPYVPADNLVLAQNIRITAEETVGHIHYNSPYAHYQHEGILYVDPKTGKGAFTNGEGLFWSRPGVAKVPSDRELEHSKFRHPLATSHWEKAMLRARRKDLVRDYQNYLRGLRGGE